jgi:hypothetical protein
MFVENKAKIMKQQKKSITAVPLCLATETDVKGCDAGYS